MEHNCPNCSIDYRCDDNDCSKDEFELCSEKCIKAFRIKKVQGDLSNKIFPDKRWY